MDRSRVELSPSIKTPIVIVSSVEEAEKRAEQVWKAPGILVLDGHRWTRPLSDIQQYQDPRPREFDTPFATKETPKGILGSFSKDLGRLLHRLFPGREPKEVKKSWRPMVSGPEPLHYDTFNANDITPITAYLNVSVRERHYGVSYDFPTLLRTYSEYVRGMQGQMKPIDHFCVRLRVAGDRGKGPLGPTVPRHKVWFATGSVWIFNPKLVSHELLFGDGAFCYTWKVSKEGLGTDDYFDEIIGERK